MSDTEEKKLGFKRIRMENWNAVDPIWHAFELSHSSPDPSATWVTEALKPTLAPAVPLPVQKLYEVARGTLVYSLMFYPLLTIGTEQLFRVFETAASIKCTQMSAPAKVSVFSKKVDWLHGQGVIAAEDHPRWKAVVHLRNGASHPNDQSIFAPNMALNMLDGAVELINPLFSSQQDAT